MRSTMKTRLAALLVTLPADFRLASGRPEGAARLFAERFLRDTGGGWYSTRQENVTLEFVGMIAQGLRGLWDTLRAAGWTGTESRAGIDSAGEPLDDLYVLRSPSRGDTIEHLTRKWTAFPSFAALVAGGTDPVTGAPVVTDYFPSLSPSRSASPADAVEIASLADAYDQAQRNRGDRRRAYRG